MTLTFLFGAGASAGAGAILPERPPLGAELFRELRRLCPGTWGSLPASIGAELEVDFEAGMDRVAAQMSIVVPALMRDMAVYFIQFRSSGRGSLYDRLVRDLDQRGLLRRSVFSTLNYECILEYALLDAGLQIDYFGHAGAGAQQVLKLHGSCNMFSLGVQATRDVSYTSGVVFEGGIQAWLDQIRVVEHCLVETALAPVMCQYMQGKPTSVSPRALKAIQNRWAELVEVSQAVVCVGVRPHAPDMHIWDPLARFPGKLLFIGDEGQFTEWASERRAHPSAWLASRFSTGYERMLKQLEAL